MNHPEENKPVERLTTRESGLVVVEQHSPTRKRDAGKVVDPESRPQDGSGKATHHSKRLKAKRKLGRR